MAQGRVIYLTHPQVQIDPTVAIPDWGLNGEGAARVAVLARRAVLSDVTKVDSSEERKARETAQPLAQALGCPCHSVSHMHENDRSATGYLPAAQFEQTADAFFAEPSRSVRGWERAVDAQARIVAAFEVVRGMQEDGGLLIVGHGAVGTLLYSALTDQAIDRCHDQQHGGGCFWEIPAGGYAPKAPWAPMEMIRKTGD